MLFPAKILSFVLEDKSWHILWSSWSLFESLLRLVSFDFSLVVSYDPCSECMVLGT